MYKALGNVTLKSGEVVEAGLITGPDLEWADRLIELLGHKGLIWDWQTAQVLQAELGVEAYFTVLHRDGIPFANIMSVEMAGVGLFGHVWTAPEDRRQGASSHLLDIHKQQFRYRGGQALFLETEFGSPAYQMYTAFGFQSVEANSGYMAYYAENKADFETAYFAPGGTAIYPLDWAHWPALQPLLLGEFPGVVRCAPLGIIGRMTQDERILQLIYAEGLRREQDELPRALVLQHEQTTACVGLAVWDWHPIWPDTCLLDVYCHPGFWDGARDLLASLPMPAADRYLAYVDSGDAHKMAAFARFGFQPTAIFNDRVPLTMTKTEYLNVTELERWGSLHPSDQSQSPHVS